MATRKRKTAQEVNEARHRAASQQAANANRKSTDTNRNSGRAPAQAAKPKRQTVYYRSKDDAKPVTRKPGAPVQKPKTPARPTAKTRTPVTMPKNPTPQQVNETRHRMAADRSASRTQRQTAEILAVRESERKGQRYPRINNTSISPMKRLRADTILKSDGLEREAPRPTKPKTAEELRNSIGNQLHRMGQNYAASQLPVSPYDRGKLGQDLPYVQRAKQRFYSAQQAGDKAGMAKAHAEAEGWRRKHGYSGGAAGDEYVTAKLSQDDYNRLNRKGQERLTDAKLRYSQATTDAERQRIAEEGQRIRNNPLYQAALLASADANGRQMRGMDMTPEQRAQDAHRAAAGVASVGQNIAGSLGYLGQQIQRVNRDQMDAAQMAAWIRDADNYNQAKADLEYIQEYRQRNGRDPEGMSLYAAQVAYNNAVQARAQLDRIQNDPRSLYFDPMAAERLGISMDMGETTPESLLRRAAENRAAAVEGLNGFDRFMTDSLLGVAQSAPAMALSAIPVVGPELTLGVLGAQAAGQRAYELGQEGVDSETALLRGLVSGSIEAAFERIPVANWTRLLEGKAGRNALKEILKQTGEEATEEAASYVVNYVADLAARDPNASFSWAELAENAGMGAVGGAAFGGVGSMIGSMRGSTQTEAERAENPAWLLEQAAQTRAAAEQAEGPARQTMAILADLQERTGNGEIPYPMYAQMARGIMAQQETQAAAPAAEPARIAEPSPVMQTAEPVQRPAVTQTAREAEEISKTGEIEQPGATTEQIDIKNEKNRIVNEQTKAEQRQLELMERYQEIRGRMENAQTEEEVAALMGEYQDWQQEWNAAQRETQTAPAAETAEPEQTPTAENRAERQAEQNDRRTAVLARESRDMGQAGQEAILAAYDGREALGEYHGAFTDVYLQSLGGTAATEIQKPAALSVPQFTAAAEAGIRDRAAGLAAENRRAARAAGRNARAGVDWKDSYVRKNLDRQTAKTIDRVAKALGVQVIFADEGTVLTGTGQRANAEITGNTVRIEKNNKNPVRALIGHELTHRMQDLTPESYRAFRDYVMSRPGATRAMRETQRLYDAGTGKDFGMEAAMDELAADYAGELFESSEALQKFIQDNYGNRTLLERVLDFFRKLHARLTGQEKQQAGEAVRLLEEALKGAEKQVKEIRRGETKGQNNTAQEDEKAPRLGGDDVVLANGARFSISPKADADYMAAVKRGDMETAQRMVDEAAKKAGYERFGDFFAEKSLGLKEPVPTPKQQQMFEAGKKYGDSDSGFNQFFAEDPDLGEYYVYNSNLQRWYYAGARDEMPEYRLAIRYGDIPEEGRSRNWATGELERGVSAVDFLTDKTQGKQTIYDAIYGIQDTTKNIIGGWDFGIFGSDGEPLLVAAKNVVPFTEVSKLKLAEPVTYDDNGDVIPLSERFDAEREDIRYSIGTEGYDRARLLRENEILREKVNYWRSQVKGPERKEVEPKAVRKLAREIKGEMLATMSQRDIADRLEEIYNGLRNDWSYDKAFGEARKLALEIVEGSEEIDDTAYREYEALRRFFRTTPLVLSQSDRAGITDYNDWRKRNMGRMLIKHGDKSNVDVIFHYAAQIWPEWFDDKKTPNPEAQLEVIEDVLGSVQMRRSNPFEHLLDEAVDGLATHILEENFSLPSMQDYRDAELERMGRRYQERQKKAIERAKENMERRMEEQRKRAAGNVKRISEQQQKKELRGQIVREAGRLTAKLLRGSDKNHIPKELRETVAAALANINLSSTYAFVYGKDAKYHWEKLNDAGPGAEHTRRTKAFEEIRKALEAIKDEGELNLDPMLFGSAEEDTRGLFAQMTDLRDIPIGDLSLEQLRTVWRTIRAVSRAVTTYGKTMASEKYQYREDWAKDIEETAKTRRDMRAIMPKKLILDLETPYTYFSQLGEPGLAVYRMLRDAQDMEQRRVEEITEKAQKIADEKTVKKWKSERHTFEITWLEATEEGMEPRSVDLVLTTDQIMDLWLLSRRQQAKDHLLEGGIVQPEIREGGRTIHRGTDAIRISEEMLHQITATLTQEQREVAKKLQALDTGILAGWGNEASMRAYGYEKFLDRDYWTIHTAKEANFASVEKNANNPRSVRNFGLAKNTVPHANNPLDLLGAFDNFGRHAMQMITYASWLNPMEDANRIYNWKFKDAQGNQTGRTIKSILNRVIGRGADDYWQNLMTDIQNGIRGDSDTATMRLINKAIGNAKGAAVGANLRVVIQQPTAFMRVYAVMNPLDVAAGLAGNPIKGWREARQWAGIAARKAGGSFDLSAPGMNQQIFFGQQSGLDRIGEASGALASAADGVTWGAIWNAAKAQTARENPGMRKDSREFLERTAEIFTDVIDQTQVVDGVLQRSQIMRSGSEILKQATAFKGEPIMSLNLLLRSWSNWRYQTDPAKRNAARKAMGTAAAALVANAVVNALAQSVWDGIRDDDDDRRWLEGALSAFIGADFRDAKMLGQAIVDGIRTEDGNTSLLQRIAQNYREYTQDEDAKIGKTLGGILLTGNLAGNLNMTGGIPFVSDFYSILQGYDVTRADADVIADVVKRMTYFVQSLEGEGKNTTWYAALQVAAQAGKLFGIPAHTIIRDVTAGLRTAAKKFDNVPLLYAVEKAIYSNTSSKNKKLFEGIAWQALKQGDLQTFEHIRADMMEGGITDGKKMDAAMKKLAEANPEVELSQEIRDLLGIRITYGEPEPEEEDSFGADDLSEEQYADYAKKRAESYRPLEDAVTEMEAFRRMTDEEKDKTLKRLWTYADETALADHSGGQYEITDSTTGKMVQAQEDGVVPLEIYSVFSVQISGLTSEEKEGGQTKQEKVIQAIRDLKLNREQSAYLFRTQYKSDANNPWA